MRVHHLAFRTGDVPLLARFYVEALGFTIRGGDRGDRVWLELDDAILMLEPRVGTEPAVPAGTLELVAFAIDADAAPAVRARLARHGVAIEAETTSTLYVRDPDGRRLGLSAYPAELAR